MDEELYVYYEQWAIVDLLRSIVQSQIGQLRENHSFD